MGQNSHIEWTDHTFNPWEGCAKVSPGGAHCYAETRNARFGGGTAPNWGKGAPRRRTSVHNWHEPLRWDRQACAGPIPGDDPLRRPRVFCASLADWLDDEVPIEWLADLLALIHQTPNLDWLLLTKRPENWRPRFEQALAFAMFSKPHHAMLPWLGAWHPDHDSGGGVKGSPVPPANVWIGTTVEDQQRADNRARLLLEIPARVHFVSAEPLLGPVDLSFAFPSQGVRKTGAGVERFPVAGIDWVICGGESGPGARPMHPEWARSLRDQCAAAGVAFDFKQWGEWAPGECVDVQGTLQCATFFVGPRWEYSTQTENQSQCCHADDAPDMFRVGKKTAGRLLDGVEHNAFP